MAQTGIPYCGSAPVPGTLWQHWNLDPVLFAGLAAVGLAYAIGAVRADLGRAERAFFVIGWAIVSLALVSPLCSLSVALFSARIGQHMMIALVGAPLVALGQPLRAAGALISRPHHVSRPPSAILAGIAFALALWFWHTPTFYAATFRSDAVYWLMHLTLFSTALLLWCSLAGERAGRLTGLVVGIGTSMQMGFLGAILTFAGHPLYDEHLDFAQAWGLSALEDQQLGGILMWVPGCSIFVLAACYSLGHLMAAIDEKPSGKPVV